MASVALQVHQAATVAQTMNVTQAVIQKAIMVPATDTARLKQHVGIAAINTTMGAP